MSSDQEHQKLPSYSEMILEAIEALAEKEGSSKTALSSFIESKYGERLSEAHSSLMVAHLARMKESGEIVMVKDNYLKPGGAGAAAGDSSVKRGRGRPPKARAEGEEKEKVGSTGEKRGRGRPPKAKDPMTAAAEKAARGMPKPRGRPPKAAGGNGIGHGNGGHGAVSSPVVVGAKRGRGRPPKVKAATFADVGFA